MPREEFEHTNPVYVIHHTSARPIGLVAFHVFIPAEFVPCTTNAKLQVLCCIAAYLNCRRRHKNGKMFF
jgi:hypothetical protein